MPRKAVKKRPKRKVKKTIKGKGVVSEAKKLYKRHKRKIQAGGAILGALGLGALAYSNAYSPYQSVGYQGGYQGRRYVGRNGNGLSHPLFDGIRN